MPKAIIIIDKFHVVRMANQALETTRKQLRGAYHRRNGAVLSYRFILLKRHRELTEMEKITLDLWTKNYPSLGIAYDLMESFFDLWDCDSRQKAYLKYHDWKAEIFDYFDHRITNAYTESLNNLIRVVNRLGRGYSFDTQRAKILFTEGLQKASKPKYQKRLDNYELRDYNFPMFDKMPPVEIVCENSQLLLDIDISTLIEKLEKGEL